MKTSSCSSQARMERSTFYSRNFTEQRKSGNANLRGLRTGLLLHITAAERLEEIVKNVEHVIEVVSPNRPKVNHSDNQDHDDDSHYRSHPGNPALVQLFAEAPRAHADQNDRERNQRREVWIKHFQPDA